MNPEMVQVIVNGVLAILARHRESGSTDPLTNEEVHNMLMADLQDGQSAVAAEFAAKGWPLPA